MKIPSLLLVLFFIVFHSYSQETQFDLKDKKILVVYGGWEGHQPKYFGEKIANWLRSQKAIVTVADSSSIYSNTELMRKQNLIVQHITMSEMTPEQSKGLLQAIASGVGLAGCHGGLGDSFRNNTEYQYMVGGQFVKHPGGRVTYTVHFEGNGDPIVNDLSDFSLHSEQYYMHVDPAIDVLATTRFSGAHDSWIEGAIIPVVWKKRYGNGKVFYTSIGHSKENYDIPEVWSLITRGVNWAAQTD